MPKKGPGFVPCTNCGGTGGVTVNEIYKDKDGSYKTKPVRKVCQTCGGKGGFHV